MAVYLGHGEPFELPEPPVSVRDERVVCQTTLDLGHGIDLLLRRNPQETQASTDSRKEVWWSGQRSGRRPSDSGGTRKLRQHGEGGNLGGYREAAGISRMTYIDAGRRAVIRQALVALWKMRTAMPSGGTDIARAARDRLEQCCLLMRRRGAIPGSMRFSMKLSMVRRSTNRVMKRCHGMLFVPRCGGFWLTVSRRHLVRGRPEEMRPCCSTWSRGPPHLRGVIGGAMIGRLPQ